MSIRPFLNDARFDDQQIAAMDSAFEEARILRRTRYGSIDQPVTLAFISGIDGHPELMDDAPPSAPPQPKTLFEITLRRIARERV